MSHGPPKGPGQGGPARGYSWPPFQPGNLAALRHGARSPRILAPFADQLAAGLAQVAPWTSAASFQGTVASWSWAEAQAVVLRAWLDEHGLVDDDDQPRPATGMLERVETRLAALRGQLGLTPLALGEATARTLNDVVAWFLDHDYDGEVFHVNQAFFPKTKAWEGLARTLKGTLDEEALAKLADFQSNPFPLGEHARAAVRVIDDSGQTSEAVISLEA